MSEQLSITPDTKLEALLAAYPFIEELLIELIPSLGSLRTPVLRKIVLGTTTLEKAADGNKVALPDVIYRLRKAACLPELEVAKQGAGAPPWVNSGQVVKTLDARPMLAQGQHPKGMVMSEVAALKEGQIFVLVTPFVPAPLVELGRAEGCKTWSQQKESGRFETYFGK
jgi:uncharacterized protein (DUF2249 family)